MTLSIGKFLQIAGLIILPIGFSIGMFGGNIQTEVRLMFAGGAIFFAGWLLTRKRA